MSFGDVNRVNTNLQSLGAQFSLNKINSQLANNQLKLSTGLRINKAEDDSAGFSIASKLSGKIGGMNQAMRNIGDAKSMLDVAETGMNTIMDTLVQMKSKATQAANDTLGQEERDYIGKQIESMANEINDVSGQTKFQGTKLLNGGAADTDSNGVMDDLSLTFQVGESSSDKMSVNLSEVSINALFTSIKTDNSGSAIQNGASTPADVIGVTGAAGSGGTMDIKTSDESATDYADSTAYRGLIGKIDSAISTLASSFNQIGIHQNSLSIKQDNLSQSITSNSAARSRIQDTDFAKVQSQVVRQQIQQQTATAALAQANSSPQAVLGFLGR